jgi:hypothetical protein
VGISSSASFGTITATNSSTDSQRIAQSSLNTCSSHTVDLISERRKPNARNAKYAGREI